MALFGADCGVRIGGDDHAKDTVYRDVGIFQKNGDLKERYPVEVEGNFGGVARTNWIYDSCRLMLAEVIQSRSLKVCNASDGAFVPGAVPRVPEAIEPTTGPIDHAAVLAALKRALNEIEPATIFAEVDLGETAKAAERLFDDLDEMLTELGGGEPDFAAVYRAIREFIDKAGDGYGRTDPIISGSLVALPRIAMFFGFRIDDFVIRKELFSLFIKEFRDTVEEMKKGVTELFGRLTAMADQALVEPPASRLAS
jgi:hypothetical protein